MKNLLSVLNRSKKAIKDKKGFTLVELIIVIVILAILIGVTIGGIYKYVADARRNTDLNNASAMQSVLSTVATDKDVYAWSTADPQPDAVIYTWDNAVAASALKSETKLTSGSVNFGDKLAALFPDGLPASKTAKFALVISPNNGNPVVTVNVVNSSFTGSAAPTDTDKITSQTE